MGAMTPAAVVAFWIDADDPGIERELRKHESAAGLLAKRNYQREQWELWARRRLGI